MPTSRARDPYPCAYPQVLVTMGDHLRTRRLDRGILQREVADQLGVEQTTVTNWELNHTEPELRFFPGIVRFLGHAPWAAGVSTGERLVAYRRERGLSQAALSRCLGVDPGALSRWERNLRIPTGRYARLAKAFSDYRAPSVPPGPSLSLGSPNHSPGAWLLATMNQERTV